MGIFRAIGKAVVHQVHGGTCCQWPTHSVGWLLSGGVGRLVRANYVTFFGEDGEHFDFLAALLCEPKLHLS